MPEIGATLREARMRARIDISEVEEHTKIRAKYLRALENEEWDLLPGPTYVRTFLRTYAEELGLDGKLLVEEYRRRFERPEAMPIAPLGAERRGRSPRPAAERRRREERRPAPRPPGSGRAWIVGLAVIGLVVALYFVGRNAEEEDPVTPPATTTERTETTSRERPTARERRAAERRRRRRATPTTVRLRVVATDAPVYVCLEGPGEDVLEPAQTLAPGDDLAVRARRVRANFGNGNVRVTVNGRRRAVEESTDPVGYEYTPRGVRELDDAERPDCAA